MAVVANDARQVFEIPGIRHQTLASRADGLEGLEVWMQTLAPGAATPVHYHECEEVIVVHRGSGHAVIGEETIPFGPNTTLVIPEKVIHQLVNGDGEEMFLVAALSETPARVFTPDGEPLALPWGS
ncbi:MAG: cupin domain-containing protein [Deltaproteobacteria bacterium]|nr:cupin domain-containing protein [Deltaproteobacteria bacterium]